MEAMEPLDRKEAAQHLAKLAFHVNALAKLFDPSIKTATKVSKAGKGAADAADKPPRPKREPTPYTLYIKDQMPAFKEQHPEMPQKERFRALAAQWQQDPLNPKHAAAAAAAGPLVAAGGEAEGEVRKEKKHKKHKKHDDEAAAGEGGEKKHKKHKHREEEA